MKEYRNYIFDLYGTLVDIHTDEWKDSFWKKVVSIFFCHGAKYDARQLRDSYFSKVRELEDLKKETAHHVEIDLREVFADLYRFKGVAADEDLIRETMEAFRKDSLTHLRLYAGAKDLLDMLKKKGKGIYLLSNAQEVFTLKELKDLGIYEDFDDIFISSVIGYKKPDPTFFRALIDKHSLDVKDSLMIGNDPYCDVQGALDVGMDACYIRCKLSPKESCDIRPTYYQDGMDLKALKRKIDRSIR